MGRKAGITQESDLDVWDEMSYEGVGRVSLGVGPTLSEALRGPYQGLLRGVESPAADCRRLLPPNAARGDAMAGAWLPGAERVRATRDGGGPVGGAPRVVWHAAESDPKETSARCTAYRLEQMGWVTHLVWNPLTGEIVQMLPATRAARGLRGGAGSMDPNREGRMCLQIEVLGFSSEPFTGGPLRGLDDILRWLDSWGVPRCWPAGSPPVDPACRDDERDRARWSHGGHFGHSQVPGNKHAHDPGDIDIAKLVPRCRVTSGDAGSHVVWGS